MIESLRAVAEAAKALVDEPEYDQLRTLRQALQAAGYGEKAT